ncbi:MAG: biotin/lipoyl-binding protein [Ktedonobacteraceae bacterium]|nr:biotin/lipoyl-binding protein [Ktedonobacteraceae bacterium]
MDTKKKTSWLDRIEEIITVLDGSTVGEIELTEGDTEIIIRRSPGMVMSTVLPMGDPGHAVGRASRGDSSQPVLSPITGVYYASASPTSSSFVNVGDVIHTGQVVALIEAMKVFNEITAEVSGRVVAIVATNGNVVQKGDVLLRVEPV